MIDSGDTNMQCILNSRHQLIRRVGQTKEIFVCGESVVNINLL